MRLLVANANTTEAITMLCADAARGAAAPGTVVPSCRVATTCGCSVYQCGPAGTPATRWKRSTCMQPSVHTAVRAWKCLCSVRLAARQEAGRTCRRQVRPPFWRRTCGGLPWLLARRAPQWRAQVRTAPFGGACVRPRALNAAECERVEIARAARVLDERGQLAGEAERAAFLASRPDLKVD